MPESAQQDNNEDVITGLSEEQLGNIVDAVKSGDAAQAGELIYTLSVPEGAELISAVPEPERQEILEKHAEDFDPHVFNEIDDELCRISLSELPAEQVANIVSQLDSDDSLDLIINLDPDFQKEIIRKLSYRDRIALEEGLSFPEESAGRLMQREFVAIPQFWTVGKTIDYLRAAGEDLPDEFFDIFVIDPSYHVVGEIPLNRLVRAKRSEKMEHLKLDALHPIPAALDQEEVTHIFRRENLTSAPVVDEENRLIGVITIDDVVDVIDEEIHEDIMKMSGVETGDLYRAVMSTTASRFRWLLVNLGTAILASLVIAMFGATIDQIVALAILMPIVASMGGNAGTQALTVAVRALATKQLSKANAWRIIWKETLVGTLNGAAFAVITGLIAGAWFASATLGAVIAAAMIINLIVAGLCGAGIPIVLQRIGSDPAVSSTVVLTTVTDVIGFFAFLGLAAVFLI